jgi:hypothetical protein
MSKMLKVTPTDDYTLLVEFENGNLIEYDGTDLTVASHEFDTCVA